MFFWLRYFLGRWRIGRSSRIAFGEHLFHLLILAGIISSVNSKMVAVIGIF